MTETSTAECRSKRVGEGESLTIGHSGNNTSEQQTEPLFAQ